MNPAGAAKVRPNECCSAVTGNITASERVVLESGARVKGQIFTRALSMRLGAILDVIVYW